MIQAISRCKDAERRKIIGATQLLLPPEETDLCNNFISKEPDYFDPISINFPRHRVFGHVHSDSDPLDDVDSWKEVVQQTKKPMSVGPHKSKPKKKLVKRKQTKRTRNPGV